MPNGPVSGANSANNLGRGLPPLDDSRTRSNPLTAAQHLTVIGTRLFFGALCGTIRLLGTPEWAGHSFRSYSRAMPRRGCQRTLSACVMALRADPIRGTVELSCNVSADTTITAANIA